MSTHVKRLYRATDDEARLAGVCAGIGRYLGVDPTVVRLVGLGATLVTGLLPGMLTYAAGWWLVPEEPRRLAASDPGVHTTVGVSGA